MFDQATETANPHPNKLNWLNSVFYILNFIVTYGVGTKGWLGNGSNAELSEKYQVSSMMFEWIFKRYSFN